MSKPTVNEVATYLQKAINNYTVNTQGCWIHQGPKQNQGYAYISKQRGTKVDKYLAHRLSYALYKGTVPDNLLVLHTCDVKSCINPEHLYLGTKSDNGKDTAKSGLGLYNGSPVLTEDDVGFILYYHSMGYSYSKIAELVGISKSSVAFYVKKGE
jgi:hypothetical protein